MKKLLILTRSLSVTEGQGRYSVELIKRLAKDFKITVYTSELPKSHEKDLERLDIKIKELPSISKLTHLTIFLRQILRIFPDYLKADLIHSFSDYPYCIFFSFFPFFFKPRFFTVHGTYGVKPLDNKKTSFLLRLAYRTARRVFCVSQFTKGQILKRIKLDNLVVINNGINLEKFKTSNHKIIKENDKKIILSVGNLKYRKGYHISIPAIAKVKKNISEIIYYIVGTKPDKDYLEQLKKLVVENNLQKNVIFLENLTDEELLKLYYLCDIFLLTPIIVSNNKFEGFGLVYLEANACGKPVIGTKGCGAEDAIRDGVTGILVTPNDIQATFQALKKILINPELAKNMGEAGRQYAQELDWQNVVKKYQAIYNQL